jgi:uncharacterized protein YcbK (DUF882 family)
VGQIRQGRAGAARGRLRAALCGVGAALAALLATSHDPRAAGETRSLSFFHTHTGESATITFRRDGAYDPEALKQLNWLLRDWRVGDPARMDPLLFDILWEVYREAGSREPIHVISAYRSPRTNSMLRRASGGVAENSQHIQGKAIDIRLPDVDTARLREVAMRLQYGGVGFYPSSKFVHVDTGSVRAWPRMSQDQLARLFPDGKTLHLPANGGPLPGYDVAKAEIPARNAALAAQASTGGTPGGSLASAVASLFRGRADQSAATPALPAQVAAYAPVAQPLPVQAAAVEPAAGGVPLPPRRPVALAAAAPVPSVVPAPAADEERSAVQALFAHTALYAPPPQEPRIVLAQVRVAPHPADGSLDLGASPVAGRLAPGPAPVLAVARFTGPAVQAPGIIRTADAAF